MTIPPDRGVQLGEASLLVGQGLPEPADPASEPPTDSEIIAWDNDPEPTLAECDRIFREKIAGKIHSVLVRAYVKRRGKIAREARDRRVSVEVLIAGYLARVIMDKVDGEYL
jgi:hypothetical protein